MTPDAAMQKMGDAVEGLPYVAAVIYRRDAGGEGVIVLVNRIEGHPCDKEYAALLGTVEEESVEALRTGVMCAYAHTARQMQQKDADDTHA
jgi:hypothetical protein